MKKAGDGPVGQTAAAAKMSAGRQAAAGRCATKLNFLVSKKWNFFLDESLPFCQSFFKTAIRQRNWTQTNSTIGLKKLDTEPVKTGSFRFFNPQSKKGSVLKPGQNFRSAARSQKKLLEKRF